MLVFTLYVIAISIEIAIIACIPLVVRVSGLLVQKCTSSKCSRPIRYSRDTLKKPFVNIMRDHILLHVAQSSPHADQIAHHALNAPA